MKDFWLIEKYYVRVEGDIYPVDYVIGIYRSRISATRKSEKFLRGDKHRTHTVISHWVGDSDVEVLRRFNGGSTEGRKETIVYPKGGIKEEG